MVDVYREGSDAQSRIVIGVDDRRLCHRQLSVDDRLLLLMFVHVVLSRFRWHDVGVGHVIIVVLSVGVYWYQFFTVHRVAAVYLLVKSSPVITDHTHNNHSSADR